MDTLKPDKNKIRNTVTDWILLNVGTFMLAVGVFLFKSPNHFATGGVSGLSILLAKPLQSVLPNVDENELMTIINAAINVVLLVIGFIFLGKGCSLKTTYCTLMSSLEMWLLKFIPVPLPLTDSVFMEFCYAMLLTGVASAILFNCKASSGGTDIIALIVKKYSKMNVGTALIITDFLIAAATFPLFGVTAGLYSMLGLFAKSFIVDGVIENIGKSKYVTIITTHPEVSEKYILENIHRGTTSFKATGGYTGEERTVIITVCKRSEALKLKLKIHSDDPSAFVIITDANEIFGKRWHETLD